MSNLLCHLQRLDKEWNLRRLALLALPALLVGLVLRVMLMVDMPYGSFHPDSADLLSTPDRLINEWHFGLHPKKTFLTPLLYTAAFCVPKVPVLVVVPAMQHLLGLGTVVIVALLCRLWFRHWQWIVVPVTLLVAVDPSLIWFEHSLMTESQFVFCTALLALAGTLYALRPGKCTFVGLCVALVLEAGARPEGKLLFAFGLLLIFLVQWRKALWPMGILLLVAIPTHFATRTSQAGLLLYTSLLRISPEQSHVAPGVERYTGQIRQTLIQQWQVQPAYPNSTQRRNISDAIAAYLKDHGKRNGTAQVEQLCTRLSMETFRKQLPEIPSYVLHKWQHTALRSPSEDFNEENLEAKRDRAVGKNHELIIRNAQALVGRPLADKEAVERFFDSTDATAKASWLNKLADRWAAVFGSLRTSDTAYPSGYVETGIPIYMLLAFCGFFLLMRRRPCAFHVSWGLALVGLFFVVLLTANVRPRFRLFFEPFWFLALGAILDVLIAAFYRFKRS